MQKIGFRPGRKGGPELPVDALIAFAEEGAPLRMADDDVRAAGFAEHPAGDLAGVGPLLRLMEILGGQTDGRSPDGLRHGLERREGRGDDHLPLRRGR